jgi:hypothetical protein
MHSSPSKASFKASSSIQSNMAITVTRTCCVSMDRLLSVAYAAHIKQGRLKECTHSYQIRATHGERKVCTVCSGRRSHVRGRLNVEGEYTSKSPTQAIGVPVRSSRTRSTGGVITCHKYGRLPNSERALSLYE